MMHTYCRNLEEANCIMAVITLPGTCIRPMIDYNCLEKVSFLEKIPAATRKESRGLKNYKIK